MDGFFPFPVLSRSLGEESLVFIALLSQDVREKHTRLDSAIFTTFILFSSLFFYCYLKSCSDVRSSILEEKGEMDI